MKESGYKSYEDLPLFLNAATVAKVLGVSPSSGYELMLVVAKSTPLRFRLAAKTAFVPLLLLFPANPLRWASKFARCSRNRAWRGQARPD